MLNQSEQSKGDGYSAYDRAAENGVDPRCIPKYLDGSPPMGYQILAPEYSNKEFTFSPKTKHKYQK